MSDSILELHFSGARALIEQQGHLAAGALFVPVPEPAPEPRTTVTVALSSDFGSAELECQVVQVFPGTGMALAPVGPESVEALQSIFGAAADDGGEDGELDVAWAGEGDAGDESGGDGTLFDQLRAMSVAEKRKVALHGTRAERLLLVKDTNKTLQPFLLKNPRITVEEVRALAGNRQANPEALKMIAEHRQWGQNVGVVTALVRNPKTPTPLALRLLPRLPMSEIRQLAKAGGVPMAVTQAARKKVVGGG